MAREKRAKTVASTKSGRDLPIACTGTGYATLGADLTRAAMGTRFEKGIGCLAIAPAAWIGFAGLNDGAGPTGWRGFAEMFGWFIACALTAFLFAFLLATSRRAGAKTLVLAIVVVAFLGLLAYDLLKWLGLDAPMSAKVAFTFSLQTIGSLGTAGFALWVGYALWNASRR